MTKKKSKKPARRSYMKPVVKKKHEAGWLSIIKIGVIAAIIYLVLALIFGYGGLLSIPQLLMNAVQVGVLIIIVIIFIVGLITISENTSMEVRK